VAAEVAVAAAAAVDPFGTLGNALWIGGGLGAHDSAADGRTPDGRGGPHRRVPGPEGPLIEVDGSVDVEGVADIVAGCFQPFLDH
jgi:hypothetical protein